MKKKLLTSLLFSACVLFPAITSADELHIRIDSDASADGTRIAIAPFGPLAKVMEADLQRSGRFALIDPARVAGMSPDALRAAGAQYAVVGSQSSSLDFQLIDVGSGQPVGSFRIPAHPNQRRMAHKAADLVFEKITGVKGAFDTRIAYVSASGPARGQTFQLIVSDADGFNPRTIASSNKPLMSPSWSPNGNQVAYVSYESGRPMVYVQDLASGGKRAISAPGKSTTSPSWSPDGQTLAVSVAEGRGDYNIYTVGANGGGMRQITSSKGIDTEPQWASGSTLVFTSDRSGQPQLYQTSAAGGDGSRMSFNGSYNAGASIAGNNVAMVRQSGGGSNITVMNAASHEERTVSRGTQDDSPAIAPNGTMVLYATDAGGRGSLAVASDNGKAHQILYSQAGDVRDPAWSSYLN
jgi:TolB protein